MTTLLELNMVAAASHRGWQEVMYPPAWFTGVHKFKRDGQAIGFTTTMARATYGGAYETWLAELDRRDHELKEQTDDRA